MADSNTKARPKLQNLDDLFKLNDGVNPLEKSVPIFQTLPTNKRAVESVGIGKLMPFSGHLFRLYDGERLDDMVASIKANGVLVPVIARRLGEVIEILSGHNRVNAAKIAGLTEVPTLIYENISDGDAMVYVIETNLIQRSFTDMAHSEKAAVIALHHSKIFSQGKRNDILAQLERLDKPHEHRDNDTSAEIRSSSNTRESVACEYSLKPNQVALYLRIQNLITPLQNRLDMDEYALSVAASLSFLSETEQLNINECMECTTSKIDMKKAEMLRKYSKKGRLDADAVKRIMSGEVAYKPVRTPTVKVCKTVYAKCFKSGQSAKEVQEIVEKALEMYLAANKEASFWL